MGRLRIKPKHDRKYRELIAYCQRIQSPHHLAAILSSVESPAKRQAMLNLFRPHLKFSLPPQEVSDVVE